MIKAKTTIRQWASNLKNNKSALVFLIGLDIFMAVASNIADWHWLSSVDWYLMPFTPICSLYPLTLAIWFTIFARGKRPPNWFTTFIFIGIISYGVMAYIYYPMYMAWDGVHWRLIGNMAWVTVYALQSFVIADHLVPLKIHQYLLIISYFAFKDFSDRYLGSFIDVLRPDFPQHLKDGFGVAIVLLHIAAITVALRLSFKNQKAKTQIPVQKPQPSSPSV